MRQKDKKYGPFDITRTSSLTGLTAYMLDYLCRSEVWLPSQLGHPGKGRDRQYTFGDIVVLRSLTQLLRGGISVRKLRNSLRVLRDSHPEITPTSAASRYLITDGVQVYFKDNGSLEELPQRQLAFAFVVKLEQLRKELAAELRKSA